MGRLAGSRLLTATAEAISEVLPELEDARGLPPASDSVRPDTSPVLLPRSGQGGELSRLGRDCVAKDDHPQLISAADLHHAREFFTAAQRSSAFDLNSAKETYLRICLLYLMQSRRMVDAFVEDTIKLLSIDVDDRLKLGVAKMMYNIPAEADKLSGFTIEKSQRRPFRISVPTELPLEGGMFGADQPEIDYSERLSIEDADKIADIRARLDQIGREIEEIGYTGPEVSKVEEVANRLEQARGVVHRRFPTTIYPGMRYSTTDDLVENENVVLSRATINRQIKEGTIAHEVVDGRVILPPHGIQDVFEHQGEILRNRNNRPGPKPGSRSSKEARPPESNDFLTVAEAAEQLGITREAVVQLIHRQRLPAKREGTGRGRWRVDAEAVRSFHREKPGPKTYKPQH